MIILKRKSGGMIMFQIPCRKIKTEYSGNFERYLSGLSEKGRVVGIQWY